MSTKTALLVIDVQNDFLPQGSLAAPVPLDDALFPSIFALLDPSQYQFDAVVLTQDWHPKDHTSFASNHADVKPFEQVTFKSPKKGEEGHERVETVWPNHCVQHTQGADFPEALSECYKGLKGVKTIIQKGKLQDRDYYSAFNDIWDDDYTELDSFLKQHGIQKVIAVGIAYDFCVKYTCESAAKLGYETVVVKSVTRAINLDSLETVDEELISHGVKIAKNLDDDALKNVKVKSKTE